MSIRAFLWAFVAFFIVAFVLIKASGATGALNPPVKYVGGAPCRTVKVDKGTFRMDGRTFRITHVTWCGDEITLRVKPGRP